MTGQQSEAAGAAPKSRALRPRDAATLIIVDSTSGEPRVLLGRRRLDMAFMPGRYVFPGECRYNEFSELLIETPWSVAIGIHARSFQQSLNIADGM